MRPTPEQLFGPAGTPRVVVVGAGFGGIATGVKLRQAGIHTFTIYESSLGIGGTWWDNAYPGAEVDVGSHLYCFSFKAHDWTRTHARQPGITIGFGHGAHSCLGAALARLESKVAIEELARRWRRFEVDEGGLRRVHMANVAGYANVPVRAVP